MVMKARSKSVYFSDELVSAVLRHSHERKHGGGVFSEEVKVIVEAYLYLRRRLRAEEISADAFALANGVQYVPPCVVEKESPPPAVATVFAQYPQAQPAPVPTYQTQFGPQALTPFPPAPPPGLYPPSAAQLGGGIANIPMGGPPGENEPPPKF